MRCRTCKYSLWNLAARTCPECGDPFAPSDYHFRPNSVEFRCPHCAQPYFGTDPLGHLSPREFECVTCHQHVSMDAMVLVPAPNTDPERAVLDEQAWIDRRQIGRRRAWWKTSLLGMINPIELARCTPDDARLSDAWKFAAINLAMVNGLGYLLVVAFGLIGALIAMSGGSGGASIMLMVIGVYGVAFAALYILQLVFIAIWIWLTHAFLKITGGAPRPMRATSLSILYTSGAYLPNILPCFNYISWLWWPITAGIMLKDMQGVSGWRAIIGTLATPILIVVGVIALYAAFIAWIMTLASPANMNASLNSVRTTAVAGAIIQHQSATGSGPDHALQLIADGTLSSYTMSTGSVSTPPSAIPAGDTTLDQFMILSRAEQHAIAQAAADALPDDVTAHRLGDLVFTHHGFTTATDFNLWVVVLSPDPDANPGQYDFDGLLWVGLASGSVEEIDALDFDQALADQNALRATHDLAPLPHPADVTHDAPATASTPSSPDSPDPTGEGP